MLPKNLKFYRNFVKLGGKLEPDLGSKFWGDRSPWLEILNKRYDIGIIFSMVLLSR